MNDLPKTIYLVPTSEGWNWCDTPAPGSEMIESEAVEYTRVDKWISVADRLPEAGSWYLCNTQYGMKVFIEILFYDGHNESGHHWLKDGDFNEKVTHWQPLPESRATTR